MAATKSMPAPPEVIAGRYKIEKKLGQGGMGSVWRAQHLTLRSPVAIKLIDPSLAASEDAVARFLREAQAAASLRSPHVVQILDHGVDQGVPYIAMELLEGESLADRLARTGRLSSAETARIMTHVARAMSRAHEGGIVHRDLKPDNVFLVRNDDEEIAKVLDFGIAKATSSAFDVTTGTRTGAMLGTPYYMSPEQVEGSKSIDHRTDLWALAVITFECVTGARPFESETLGALLLQICAKPITVPSQHGPVPAGFDAWFARATQRVPAERFQSARVMVDALRVVLTPGADVQPVLPTPPRGTLGTAKEAVDAWRMSAFGEAAVSSVQPKPSRNRKLPLLIAGACLLLLVAAVLLLGRSRDATPAADKAQPHLVRPAQPPASPAAPSANAVAHATATAAAPVAPPQFAPPPVAPAPVVAAPPKAVPEASAAAPQSQPAIRQHAASTHERAKPRPSAAASPASHPAPGPTPAATPSMPKPARPQAKPTDLGF